MTAEQELWERSRGGDTEAFGEIYEIHARAVHRYCLWRSGNTQVAEDVAASVFLEAWRMRARLSLTTPTAAPLLLGIANNVMRQRWRTMRRHRAAIERIKGAEIASSSDHEAEVASKLDASHRVREAGEAIRSLPRHECEVL